MPSCKTQHVPPSDCAFREGIRLARAGSRSVKRGEVQLASALAEATDGFRDGDSPLGQAKSVGTGLQNVARKSNIVLKSRREQNQEVLLPPSLLLPIA